MTKASERIRSKTSSRARAPSSAAPPQATSSSPAIHLAHAAVNPGQASPADMLSLQHAYGNGAVQRLLANQGVQAKLTVGAAHDSYEQEADRMADQVMRTSSTSPVGAFKREQD